MNESFDGKVALVTGSGSGIGLATAKALVAAGHTALAIRCDVADKRQVAAMVEQTVSPADGWMRRSTMPACRALSQKPLMPAAKHATACMRSVSVASEAA